MGSSSQVINIKKQFRGPPEMGNGGYVSGLLAKALDGPAIVTLKAPVPLDAALDLITTGDRAELVHQQQTIAHGHKAPLILDTPSAPRLREAEDAEKAFAGYEMPAFCGCFVCGSEREKYDGLRIFAGAVSGKDNLYAAAFQSHEGLADDDGFVREEFIWAALDCPGYWAMREQAGYALLGRFHAQVEAKLKAGTPAIVTAWAIKSEGRKHQAGTALFDERGALIAKAHALWISVNPERISSKAA